MKGNVKILAKLQWDELYIFLRSALSPVIRAGGTVGELEVTVEVEVPSPISVAGDVIHWDAEAQSFCAPHPGLTGEFLWGDSLLEVIGKWREASRVVADHGRHNPDPS